MEVRISHVSKKIGANMVLEDVSLTMESGHIYGLKGRNGSGKTMLMRCLCGLIYPTSGTVALDDQILGKDILIPPSVGALIEAPAFLPEYSGMRNLRFLADLQGGITDEQIAQQITDVGLNPDDTRPFRKYSLGMKQRLGIAAALLGSPKLIILDEPMNAIDEAGKKAIRELFLRKRNAGCLVVLADHDSQELETCSDVVFELSQGQLLNSYKPDRKLEGTIS